MIELFDFSIHPVLLGLSVATLLVLYHTVMGFFQGSVKQWVDVDFPEVVHTPKPTWLVGFRFNRHGVEETASLDVPIILDYTSADHLGSFGVDGDEAWKMGEKEQVTYDFGVELDLLPGGKVVLVERFKKISITEIEPIIEDNADVTEANEP